VIRLLDNLDSIQDAGLVGEAHRARVGQVMAALAVTAACLALPPAVGAAESERIVVVREPGMSAPERSAIRRAVDARLTHTLSMRDAEVVQVPDGRLGHALDELNRRPDVRFAEPDARVHALYQPELFGSLYGLQRIAAPAAWPLSRGSGVTVAVVDTGISSQHPDLRNRIATNPAERLNGVDDDGNGLTDDVRGWDFVGRDNAPIDLDGHGSQVSGTIAAELGNQVGIAGVAPDARVLPLKALDDDGAGYVSDVAAAFDLAGRMGVPVVNASLGASAGGRTIELAIERHPGTLYVAAAGNERADNDGLPVYPCNARAPNVICVGASDQADQRASFSNIGARSVDVFAPGVGILSTVGGSYATASGTSFAAPHVAGIAALVLARNPGASALTVKNAVLSGADRVPGLSGLAVTGGRANALRALTGGAADADADGVGDLWDGCPGLADAAQADGDGDGTGDVCEDGDGDGITDPRDGCPQTAAPGSADGCAARPAAVPDRDGDGEPDASDRCPGEPATTATGCPIAVIERLSLRAGEGRRRLVVRLELDRPATVNLTATRRRACSSGSCRWRTIGSKRVAVPGSSATAAVAHRTHRRFPPGRYRVRASVEDVAGTSPAAVRALRIRR
jgi:subtilisin family serine protease